MCVCVQVVCVCEVGELCCVDVVCECVCMCVSELCVNHLCVSELCE